MHKRHLYLSGFTLMELMVAIAIVGILAAFAIPAYIDYVNKARFNEVVQSAAAYKTAVATCIMVLGDKDTCSQGQNGIPVPQPSKNIDILRIEKGMILAQGKGNPPLNATYSLQAELNANGVEWVIGGTCSKLGLC
jgi:type IV pilus assembly protein PilA